MHDPPDGPLSWETYWLVKEGQTQVEFTMLIMATFHLGELGPEP